MGSNSRSTDYEPSKRHFIIVYYYIFKSLIFLNPARLQY